MGIQGFKIIARQRARMVGKMLAIEKNIIAEQLELASLRARIAAFDEVLGEQGIDIDADLYAPPVVPTPRLYYFEHGELTSRCLNLLRSQCRPLTPVQILNALVAMKKLTWRDIDDPQKLRRGITNTMRIAAKRGLVIRVGNTSTKGNADGIWALPEYVNVTWEPEDIIVVEGVAIY